MRARVFAPIASVGRVHDLASGACAQFRMMNMHIFAPETADIHAARILYDGGNRTRVEAQRHRQNSSRMDRNSTFRIAHSAQYRVPDLRKGHPPWAYDMWSAGADVFSRLVTGFRILDPLSSHLKECTRSGKGVRAEATAWRTFASIAEHRVDRRQGAFASRLYACMMGAYLRDEKAR